MDRQQTNPVYEGVLEGNNTVLPGKLSTEASGTTTFPSQKILSGFEIEKLEVQHN